MILTYCLHRSQVVFYDCTRPLRVNRSGKRESNTPANMIKEPVVWDMESKAPDAEYSDPSVNVRNIHKESVCVKCASSSSRHLVSLHPRDGNHTLLTNSRASIEGRRDQTQTRRGRQRASLHLLHPQPLHPYLLSHPPHPQPWIRSARH